MSLVSSDKVALAVGEVEVALKNETADPLGAPLASPKKSGWRQICFQTKKILWGPPWHPLRNQALAQETNLVPHQKVALRNETVEQNKP